MTRSCFFVLLCVWMAISAEQLVVARIPFTECGNCDAGGCYVSYVNVEPAEPTVGSNFTVTMRGYTTQSGVNQGTYTIQATLGDITLSSVGDMCDTTSCPFGGVALFNTTLAVPSDAPVGRYTASLEIITPGFYGLDLCASFYVTISGI